MTDLDAIRARDAEWTDVADTPALTPLHRDLHEGATHLERRPCAKAAIIDRRDLLAALDAALARERRLREAADRWLAFYGPIETYGDERGMVQLDHGHEEYEARMDLVAALAETLDA